MLIRKIGPWFCDVFIRFIVSKVCFFRAVQQLNCTEFEFLKYLIFFEKTNKAQSHFVKNLIKFSAFFFYIDINLCKLPGFYLIKFSYLYFLRKRSILNFYLQESVHIFKNYNFLFYITFLFPNITFVFSWVFFCLDLLGVG